jgi:hypothetical protein
MDIIKLLIFNYFLVKNRINKDKKYQFNNQIKYFDHKLKIFKKKIKI